jgi:hypothetical protein
LRPSMLLSGGPNALIIFLHLSNSDLVGRQSLYRCGFHAEEVILVSGILCAAGMFIAMHDWGQRGSLPYFHVAELSRALAEESRVSWLTLAVCRSGLASEPFGPLNGIHALGFFAALVEAARLVKSSLGPSHILGGGSTGTFRLLSRRGPAADLALHVLGRSGASLRRLAHGSGWRMLLTGGRVCW